MNDYCIRLTPRDPLIARDGRPFGASTGNRMRSLPWFYPSVLAGSLRSLLGKRKGGFDSETVRALKKVEVAGPFPQINNTLFFPKPLDCQVFADESQQRFCYSLRPSVFRLGEGADFPSGTMQPALLPASYSEGEKPAGIAQFWSQATMVEWLINANGESFPTPIDNTPIKQVNAYWPSPVTDTRVHTQIGLGKGVADDGLLFISAGLNLTLPSADVVEIASRVRDKNYFTSELSTLKELHPMGGERRLVQWQASMDENLWCCPQEIISALQTTNKIRMVLSTPAVFKNGWLPGWVDENTLTGSPPGSNMVLRLDSVALERWQPLSGWGLEKGARGPKPVRRMVPAGSVYFFTCVNGKPESLSKLWLESVSDDAQDKCDGFGLALWGIWNEHQE